MGNFRKVIAGLTVLCAGVFGLVSCNVDSEPIPFSAGLDVIIQDMKTDAGVKYSIVVYASANNEIKSVKVTAPGTAGKVYLLTATSDKQQFVYLPQTADYVSELPEKGDYTFEIISMSDEKISGKDVVGAEKLAPITIKTATMANHLLKTVWDKVPNASGYVVRFYSADKLEILFSSGVIIDKAEYEFGATTYGWATGKLPVVGTNYVIELIGVKTETGVTIDKWSNLQFITLDSKTIKWE